MKNIVDKIIERQSVEIYTKMYAKNVSSFNIIYETCTKVFLSNKN